MAEHEAFFASCWLHGVHLIVTVIRLSSSCGHGGRRQLAAMATAANPVLYNTMPGYQLMLLQSYCVRIALKFICKLIICFRL